MGGGLGHRMYSLEPPICIRQKADGIFSEFWAYFNDKLSYGIECLGMPKSNPMLGTARKYTPTPPQAGTSQSLLPTTASTSGF